MCIEVNIAFLCTLVCKMFCQTNKKSCEDQNNHLFACELNFIFTNSFFTEILAIDKNLSEELGEKSVCRELISSPAPNLVSTLTQLLTFRQTMIKRPWKTTKWAKASHLNWKLWAIHDYVIMKEGKVEIECSRKVKCHEVGLSACTGGPLPGPSCVSWTLIWVFP